MLIDKFRLEGYIVDSNLLAVGFLIKGELGLVLFSRRSLIKTSVVLFLLINEEKLIFEQLLD